MPKFAADLFSVRPRGVESKVLSKVLEPALLRRRNPSMQHPDAVVGEWSSRLRPQNDFELVSRL